MVGVVRLVGLVRTQTVSDGSDSLGCTSTADPHHTHPLLGKTGRTTAGLRTDVGMHAFPPCPTWNHTERSP